MQKKISIITTFRDALSAYSLNRVVQDQIKMFSMAGYQVQVIVAKGFLAVEWYKHPSVILVEIPDVPVDNDAYIDPTFDKDVGELESAFEKILKDSDVVITHDIIYQPAAVKHNIALRKAGETLYEKQLLKKERKNITFLHWIHSGTKPSILSGIRGGDDKYMKLIQTPFPNSFYIAFNQFSIPRIAEWFNIQEGDVKYVPHPHDFLEGKDKLAQEIIMDYNLLQKDVVCMYPCRLDKGKQPEVVIKIMHQVKELGRSVSCIIADFHSTGGDKVQYREDLKKLGLNLGLSNNELVFISEHGMIKDKYNQQTYRLEIPHKAISDLFDITNVFIMPSMSETYSLVAQEAAAKRNFLVLNQDFPPFRSIYGESPLYRQFSSAMDALTGKDGETNTRYTDEAGYYRDIANYINYVQEQTRILATYNMIRKTRNLQTVFRKHIEPLLSAEPGKFNY